MSQNTSQPIPTETPAKAESLPQRVDDAMVFGVAMLHIKTRLATMIQRFHETIVNEELTDKERLTRVSAVACAVTFDLEKFLDNRLGYFDEILHREGFGPDDPEGEPLDDEAA